MKRNPEGMGLSLLTSMKEEMSKLIDETRTTIKEIVKTEIENSKKKLEQELFDPLNNKVVKNMVDMILADIRGEDGEDASPEEVADIILKDENFISKTTIGKDGKTPTREELIAIIIPLIPEPKNGIDGQNGVNGLDGIDGQNGVNGLDGIDGQNGTNGEDGKDGSPDKPDEIATKLNTLEEKVERKVIKGLDNEFRLIRQMIREKNGGGGKSGGGMGQWVHEVSAISSATTTVTTNYDIAANGNAILVRYQGQVLAHGVQYTINSRIITLTFTPSDSTYLELTYVRT